MKIKAQQSNIAVQNAMLISFAGTWQEPWFPE